MEDGADDVIDAVHVDKSSHGAGVACSAQR